MSYPVTNSLAVQDAVKLNWGQLSWLINAKQMPHAEQTFGVCTIFPNQRNPLHTHPNCEELLYVISGECKHRLGNKMIHMTPGTVICIPRDVPHYAECISTEPLVAVISFSSPDRQTVSLEGDEIA